MTRLPRIATTLCGVVLVASAISACTGHNDTPRASDTTSIKPGTSRQVLGAAGCNPASPITVAGPEVQGTGHNATLYGLIMTSSTPITTAELVKIAWRMTGSGPLRLSATSPQGKAVALQFGPEAHGGSTYDRPGDEWGAGYLFTSAGCWHLHAQRTHGSADVWIQVQAK